MSINPILGKKLLLRFLDETRIEVGPVSREIIELKIRKIWLTRNVLKNPAKDFEIKAGAKKNPQFVYGRNSFMLVKDYTCENL